MKKFVIALSALAALAASPALAGDGARIHVGFYSPQPVYYQPAPVFYAPPRFVRYEPPCPSHYGHNGYRGHHRGHGWGNRGHGFGHREYVSAWNEPRYGYDNHGWRR